MGRRKWYRRAAIAGAVLGAGAQVHAQTAASWLGGSGNWTDPTKWSTNPKYPNNTNSPFPTSYTGTISAAGTYTVTVNSSVTINSLTVNNAGTTIDLSSTLGLANGLTLSAGNLRLTGNSLLFGNVTGPGSITASGGGPVLGASALTNTAVILQGGNLFAGNSNLAFSNANIVLSDPGNGVLNRLTFGGTISGTGQLLFDGTAASVGRNQFMVASGFQVPAGMAIRTRTGSGAIMPSSNPPNQFTNRGTISAETAGQTIDISSGMANDGLLSVSNGATLTARGTFTRFVNSNIVVNNGTLNIGGTDMLYNAGTFTRTGGTVNYGGSSNNVGKTLDLSNTAMGSIAALINGASISGGTVTYSGAPCILGVATSSLTSFMGLDAVTLDADFTIAARTSITSSNGLTLANGHTLALQGTSTATTTLNVATVGGGTIVLDGDPSSTGANNVGVSDTILASTTIRTGTGSGTVRALLGNTSFVNAGTLITTAGRTLLLGGPSSGWSNTGTIQVNAGGTLILAGNFATGGMGSIIRDPAAALEISGTVNNASATLDLDTLGPVRLTGGAAISGGGVVKGSGGNVLTVDGTLGKLSEVALQSTVVVAKNSTFNVERFLNLDGGVVRLSGAIGDTRPGELALSGTTRELRGSGSVIANDENNRVTFNTISTVGNIEAGVTVKTAVGVAGRPGGLEIVGNRTTNLGTISSEVPPDPAKVNLSGYLGGTIFAHGSASFPFDNSGTVRAIDGGVLRLEHFVNNGTIFIGAASKAIFASTFTNNGTIGGSGVIVGDLVSAGTIAPGSSPGTLSIQGALTLSDTSILAIEIGGTTAGVDYDVLDVSGALALDGTLQITFVNGFQPDADDVFDFLNFASASGQFDSLTYPTLPPDVVWNDSMLMSGGSAGVPEPVGFALMSATTALLLGRRRRISRVMGVTD